MLRAGSLEIAVPSECVGRAFWWDPQSRLSALAAIGPDGGAQAPDRPQLSPIPVTELLGETSARSHSAGLWLELGEDQGRQVVAPVDDVLAYATVPWRPHASWMRVLSGLLGDTERSDGQPLLLLDLVQLLRRRERLAHPRWA